MTKLFTFLGIGRYDETEYRWNGASVFARFSPVASAQFSHSDRVIVFATEEAENAFGKDLNSSMPVPVDYVTVPKGENETQIWEVFSKIAEHVAPEEEIAFDVTHGLRSFPLIGILAAAFLRVGLNVKLKAIYYGAYDVRDQSVTPNRTPMFDLTPMLDLLEWAAAADRFNRTGDSRYFASLLHQQQKGLALQYQKDPEKLSQIGMIGTLASSLTDVSQSLSLIRPHLAMQQIEKLPVKAQSAIPILAEAHATRPFQLILDSVIESYDTLGLSDPLNVPVQDLQTQRALITWYAEHEHWTQAVSLSREWIVSWVMLQLGMKKLVILSDRHRIEEVLNSEAEEFLKAKKSEMIFMPLFLKDLPNSETVLGLWKSLSDVRNDIDHAGMRDNPQKPNDLKKHILAHIRIIMDLPIFSSEESNT